ncbi:hypothetical protein B5X24_HaOG202097 [Helicoverpa armigera]|uniref:C2H2-type domain-containing protein n=1 Tax=Helicoverpa armigera TaxID=29058 RepID=A0A2W1BW16_HELAM|nr:hypothetical protein B5X24_HaOG202097 [Helicoverpa armigera]
MMCVCCRDCFEDPETFRQHMRQEHRSISFAHKQNDPNFIAKRNAELIVKYSTVYPFKLPEDSMVCVYCCETYPDPAEFRSHMDEEHDTFNPKMAFNHCSEGFIKVDCTNINCRICFKHYQNLQQIAEHLHKDHSKALDLNFEVGLQPFKLEDNKFFCAICNAKTLCLRQLSRHTQVHFWRYTCEACGKSYATNTALRNHIRYSHIGSEKICRKCKRTFSSNEEKRKHLSESPRCWSHLCCICGQRFMSWHAKQAHLAECHGVEKKSYVCPECGQVFHERKKYRSHFRLSHTDDNYVCSCCGMKFETKKILEEHRVSHTMEKLFPCTVCPKSFPRKKNLIQHMWIHMEHKRFECKLCNKKFNQKVKVNPMYVARHNAKMMIQFTTAYPFKLPESSMVCVYCCDSFPDPAVFRDHMRTEHQDFKVKMAFNHVGEGAIKVDCTDLKYNNPMYIAKRNAQIVVQYITAYPFRLPESAIVCVYCCESFDDAPRFRKHMEDEHDEVNVRVAFSHLHEGL